MDLEGYHGAEGWIESDYCRIERMLEAERRRQERGIESDYCRIERVTGATHPHTSWVIESDYCRIERLFSQSSNLNPDGDRIRLL